jgi:hypothetical protein
VFHLPDVSNQPRTEFDLHVLMTTITAIENGTSFICTSQLYRAVPDFLPPAFRTWNLDDGLILHITSLDGLDGRPLLSSEGKEEAFVVVVIVFEAVSPLD